MSTKHAKISDMISEPETQPNFFNDLRDELRQVWQSAKDGWHHSGVSVRNGLRHLRAAELDYVVITLSGPMPERAEPPRSFVERQLRLPSPPFSIQQLNHRLQRVADADNVKGVVFILRGLSAGAASLQNIRQSVLRLREAGKTVVVYTPYLDAAHFFVASVADKIIIPPGTQFNVIGLRLETIFLKDALARVGLEADAVQISPYKTGPNFLSKAEMTPEQHEQLDWLLEETFDILTMAMADGRQMTAAEFRQLVDDAPHFAQTALDAGLVDAIAYEDELVYLLAEPKDTDAEKPTDSEIKDEVDAAAEEDPVEEGAIAETAVKNEKPPQAKLMEWREAYNLLLEKPVRFTPKFIGVISLHGAIMMGHSQRPPIDLPLPLIGSETAGEATLVSLLRQAEKMDNMAALIFHVDSPGGDALASDLIGREIQRLSQKKPVLVYMGDIAASGGYYVSAYADHIMSQSLTTTGSIGVWSVRISTGGLYQKLSINRASLERGKRAGLYSDMAPMTEDERQVFFEGITESYRQFKDVVAHGRDLLFDDLDPICEGRVWSGRQALAHKLVDSHGDFLAAVQKAAELADLPLDEDHRVPVMNLYPKESSHILPKPFEAAEEVARLLSGERVKVWSGRPLFLLPFHIRFE
ncbi:MAG: signal peptide peptidase SppA [Chloroflexi bacterium]|nr:signal peptide peptidase SppA [Chloroflexota bacterium]